MCGAYGTHNNKDADNLQRNDQQVGVIGRAYL